MDLILSAGMDVGGTKTHVLIRADGTTLAEEVVPTESWRTWDVGRDADGLTALILRVAGGRVPASVAIGAHGCDSDQQCRDLEGAIGARLASAVKVVNDSELLVPAAGYTDGIGVVAGTGSIAVARDPQGRMLAAGGWGWILGDEGSAAALVREAARAVRGAIDRDDRADVLIEALMTALDTADATKIGRMLNEVRGAASWGRYASAVFRAAELGSPLARKVIGDGGRALAELVAILVGRGASAEVVVAGGGVIAEQPTLMDAFRAGMATVSPTSHVVLLREPPVVGAALMAERLSNAMRPPRGAAFQEKPA